MLTVSIIICIIAFILLGLAIYGKITRSKALEKAPDDTVYFGASTNLDNHMDGYLYLTPETLGFICKLTEPETINIKDIISARLSAKVNEIEIETDKGIQYFKVNKRKDWITYINEEKEKFE